MTTEKEQEQPPPAKPAVRLDDIRPRVGLRVQLLASRIGYDQPLSSVLIGYLPREYVIVKTPTESGFAVPLANGERLKLRLFTGVHVVEFETSVLRQFAAPVSYWHLEYPEAVKAVVLRAARRTRVDLEASVAVEGAPEPVSARIVDLSAQGALLVAAQQFGERDAMIRIDFQFPSGVNGNQTRLSAGAKIRTVKVQPAAGERPANHLHGVQFQDVSEGDLLLLQNFVLRQIVDTPDEGG